jgi:hypothetical protein
LAGISMVPVDAPWHTLPESPLSIPMAATTLFDCSAIYRSRGRSLSSEL